MTNQIPKLVSAFVVTCVFVIVDFRAGEVAFAQPPVKVYSPVRILLNQRFERPVRARIFDGNYFVLDAKDHRVVVLDMAEHFVRQVGRYGTGPQEFFDPTDLALGSDGALYVFEAGNKRVTITDQSGARVGGFSSPEISLAIEINSKKEIILNQPIAGSLLTVYDLYGVKKRSFGLLKPPRSGFATHGGHDDKETYNRVHITVDDSDNIYAAWWYEPRVQKYAPDGKLLWDIELIGKEVDRFKEKARENNGYYKFNGQTVILSGIAHVASSDLTYVLFPSTTLYVLNSQGKQVGIFEYPVYDIWPFNSVTATSDGKLLFTDTNQGVFSVPAPMP